jgi:hypothetical protein
MDPDRENHTVNIKPDMKLTDKIPFGYVLRFEAIPCSVQGGGRFLVVSTETPQDIIDEMMRITGIWKYETRPRQEVRQLIDEAYDSSSDDKDLPDAKEVESIFDPLSKIDVPLKPRDDLDEGPIIKFVNSMLSRAIKLKASDIHLEPHENVFVVRKRIDGVLNNAANLPPELHEAVLSRIKVMANLDIAEKRLPQDGKVRVRLGGKDIDIRVSTVPTSFGERVVLRLQSRSGLLGDAAHFFKKLFSEDLSRDAIEDVYGLDEAGGSDADSFSTAIESEIPPAGDFEKSPVHRDGTPDDSPWSGDHTTLTTPENRVLSQIVKKNIFPARYPHPEEEKSAVLGAVKEMIRKWDCQEVPSSIFDFLSFKEMYGSGDTLEVLIGIEEEKMKYLLPKISSVSAGYMIGGKLPRVDFDIVAFGFWNREYTEESLVIWAVDFISGKFLTRGMLEHFENRCRLLSLEKSLSSGQLVKWLIFEGKVDAETLAYASSCGIFLSHAKQLKILFNLFDVEEVLEEEHAWDLDFEECSRDRDDFSVKAKGPQKGEPEDEHQA